MRAADIMTRQVLSVGPDAPVHDVARLLLDNNVSGVPVVDGSRVIGIITEADLIVREANVRFPSYLQILDTFLIFGDRHRYEEEVRRALGSKARDVMTENVETVAPDTEIGEVARVMFEHKINRLPVVTEDGLMVGIISRSDIIRQMVREMEAG